MTDQTFAAFGLAEPLLRALDGRKHDVPTPIQQMAIPKLLDGHDMLGVAQTGTGKTAAFVLPLLHRLAEAPHAGRRRLPRALVLAPTRELAQQIADEIRAYARHMPLRHTVIYGGVSQRRQVDALARGLDVVVATPGRLLDLMEQRRVRLDAVEVLVLDEADRMLDMGFVRDVRRIAAALPADRQSLLFSATMPDQIARLGAEILHQPVRIDIAPQSTPVERIEQRVHHVTKDRKRDLLLEVLDDSALSRVIVFTRTKHGADRVATHLDRAGISADAIHGNKSQGARQRALQAFRDGRTRVLVATDIAARGVDVPGISHVINFELPNEPESYVHRIGRTARAGMDGVSISFCDGEERGHLRSIERLTGVSLTVIGEEPPAPAADKPARKKRGTGRKRSGPPRRRGASVRASRDAA